MQNEENIQEPNDFDDEAIQNQIFNLDGRIADCLGQLEEIEREPSKHDSVRVKAISAKLSHFEERRRNLMRHQLDEERSYRLISSMETISEGIETWLRQQREIHPAPGHAVMRLSALGFKAEVSGSEDDSNYQRIAHTIEQIGTTLGQTREKQVNAMVAEDAKDREQDRKLRQQHMDDQTSED